jgi:hypothetical protein
MHEINEDEGHGPFYFFENTELTSMEFDIWILWGHWREFGSGCSRFSRPDNKPLHYEQLKFCHGCFLKNGPPLYAYVVRLTTTSVAQIYVA